MNRYFKYIGVFGVGLLAMVAYAMYGISATAPEVIPFNTINIADKVEEVQLTDQQVYDQLKGEYLDLAITRDPGVAMELVRERIETDDFLLNHCHALMHEMGHTAYKFYGDLDKALLYQDPICNSGYLHGVIEQYMDGVTDVMAAMKTMCVGRDVGRCYHGMGHGLMYYTGNQLYESLDYCSKLSGGDPVAYCAQGVFMENFNTDLKTHPSKFLKVDDPSYPCPDQQERFKSACYYYAPTFYLAQHNKNYTSALSWCTTLETNYQITCTRGVGALAIKYNIGDPKKVESICMTGTSKQVPYCIDGLVGLYMNHYDSVKKGSEMCATLEPSNQKTCYAGVASRSKLFTD